MKNSSTLPPPFKPRNCNFAHISRATPWPVGPVTNGLIIEQQQIITTQNLATLFSLPNCADALRPQLAGMARQCLTWICRRQQMKIDAWHGRLVMLKNTAYAWRQTIFY